MGSIQTIFFEKDSQRLFTAGDDGFIREWNFTKGELAATQEIFLNTQQFPKCVIAFDIYKENVLVGTAGGEIYEITYQNKKQNVILQSSFEGELWGG